MSPVEAVLIGTNFTTIVLLAMSIRATRRWMRLAKDAT